MVIIFFISHKISKLYLEYEALKKGQKFVSIYSNFFPSFESTIGVLPIPIFNDENESNSLDSLIKRRNKYVYCFWIIFLSGMIAIVIYDISS